MTVETKTTIALGDITHAEFECGKCHVRTTRPLSDDTFVPATCPTSSCDNKNWFSMGSQEHQDLRTLITLIHRYGARGNPAYKMRFELEAIKEQD
jgi:hypothetical protein